MKLQSLPAVIAALLSTNAAAEDTSIELPSMVINADFRPSLAQETPISLTTIDNELIESRGAQHLEDVLNLAPNVNISTGASRGQYFQIRGIGERSQFAAPTNPSVGLIIDGIDFSRTAGTATLFDIERVDILRGPQGTRFGTNALAGVITMQSKQPSKELEVHMEAGVAEYDTYNVGLAVGGSLIEDELLGRVSVHTHQSDGYMDNGFLNRENTQNHDEITARGQLKWLVNDDLTIDLNALHVNVDNGYDAFTFDNSRHSQTDAPGLDKQRTTAVALKSDWRVNDVVQLQSTMTYVNSDITYSYDADWGFEGQFAANLFPYVGFESFERERENYSIEVRALSNENGRLFNDSTDWVVGFYYLDQDESLNQNSDFGSFGITSVTNQYDTKNASLFFQLDSQITDKLIFISGFRAEYFEADYDDSNNLNVGTSEMLFGGKVGLNYQLSDSQLLYTSISRGYKSGGVNTDARITPGQRGFDSEYMWNFEAGVKSSWLDNALHTNISVFYALRRDVQVKSSIQDGPQFIDLQDNAAKGKNAGIEADFDWLINDNWRLFAAIGFLHATFDEYENADLLAQGIQISGRRQAHAPYYQFNVGGELYLGLNLTVRLDVEGKDDFYFSNSHHQKSSAYALLNSSINYKLGDWNLTLWGKNLLDKDYATRGFFFGNDPATGYADTKYTQKGDPRVVGLSVSWDY